MLATGTEMFLLMPDAFAERVLHPGKVMESTAEGFVAEFDELLVAVEGADVIAFAEVGGKFFQQGASVIEIRQTEPRPVFAFRKVGDVVSAEQRQTFRVSVAAIGIFARVGKEVNCPVVDLSPEGFGAIVSTEFRIGAMIPIVLNYEGQMISMTARVQTARMRADGKFRYGFLAAEKNSGVRHSLQQISSMLQRTQLRRLSGAA